MVESPITQTMLRRLLACVCTMQPTQIYLAARYTRLGEMQQWRITLESIGHVVTSRWINGSHQIDDGQTIDATIDEKIRFATEDVEDLTSAEVVIAFTEPPRSGHSRGGRHVELGMALALRKRVIVVGHRENVFCWLPQVQFVGEEAP